MNRDDQQMKIRLPNDVKRWLVMESAKNMRSQNSEIVLALKTRMEETKKDEAALQA